MSERTITRAEIIDSMVQKFGLTRLESSEMLESVLGIIVDELVEGRTVKLARFGNFIVREKFARMGRNPKTGKDAEISARRVVAFRPSPLLKQRVDNRVMGNYT